MSEPQEPGVEQRRAKRCPVCAEPYDEKRRGTTVTIPDDYEACKREREYEGEANTGIWYLHETDDGLRADGGPEKGRLESWTNQVHCGDTLDVLPETPAESVHAVVTDPPYGLAFMGRDWDDFEPREYQEWCEDWARKAKRVLKPGGHLLAFSGNRTHHRLFTGVEDAGLEVRDTITWHYGGGFPKGASLSKTIDQRKGEDGDFGEPKSERYAKMVDSGSYGAGRHEGWESPWMDDEEAVEQNAREYLPGSDEARRWKGWRTALKPSTEFVVVARKPFDGTTTDCVLEHGTGALNIGECRIPAEGGRPERTQVGAETDRSSLDAAEDGSLQSSGKASGTTSKGRYPSNTVFSEQAAADLDSQVGERSGGHRTREDTGGFGEERDYDGPGEYTEPGGPSRYFYTSKASTAERTLNGQIANDHPTVKPVDLMEWLVKLVSAEGQTVLDPFAGTGTTLLAAKNVGREFVGIEIDEKYADVARARIGLDVEDPSNVREDDGTVGLAAFADGGGRDV